MGEGTSSAALKRLNNSFLPHTLRGFAVQYATEHNTRSAHEVCLELMKKMAGRKIEPRDSDAARLLEMMVSFGSV